MPDFRPLYVVNYFANPHDYPMRTFETVSAEEAALYLERLGVIGSVVKFNRRANLPACLPEVVHESNALWTHDPHRTVPWQSHCIFDGRGGPFEVGSKP
jgi:hypothetical protein